jgi:hypothetical protein
MDALRCTRGSAVADRVISSYRQGREGKERTKGKRQKNQMGTELA